MKKIVIKECQLCGTSMRLTEGQSKQKILCNKCSIDTKKTNILKKYHSHNEESRRFLFFRNRSKCNERTRKGVKL